MPLLAPLLAGATTRDRLWACAGALIGLTIAAQICLSFPVTSAAPLLIAPIGASAVLVFAVPASPLAQPWPVIGGNSVSALIGVAVVHYVGSVPLAVGLAVGLAILAMSLLRCLHPPGGATALTAVIGGPAVLSAGYVFPLLPVAVNSAVLVVIAMAFHRLRGHAYPHKPIPAPGIPVEAGAAVDPRDLDLALRDLGEAFDVSREDLDRLLKRVAHHADERRRRPPASTAQRVGTGVSPR